MKKLFMLLLTLTMVLMSGCVATPQDTDLESRLETLETQYNELEVRVEDIETHYDNLIVTVGLNEQISLYENDEVPEGQYLSLSTFTYLSTVQTEKDYLDKTKFPDYIWDLDGEYVDVNALGNLLTQKYLGVNSSTVTGFQYKIVLSEMPDMTNEEFMVRVSMLIMELSNYDFYTIDSPELYIQFNLGGSSYIKVRMSLLVSDKYDLHPAIFWGGLLDTRIVGLGFNEDNLDTLYTDHTTNETFTGYVLDYK